MSSQAYADQMVSDSTVVPLPHGSLANDLFGMLLVLTASYTFDTMMEARAVASQKEREVCSAVQVSHFVQIAIETSGALGPDALSLFFDIDRRQQVIPPPAG